MYRAEQRRLENLSVLENALHQGGFARVAGVDEAGRGPLAGPVVAAACILPSKKFFEGLNDSKQLTEKDRDRLFVQITECSDILYGIAVVDPETIDKINILQATLLAMQQAVDALPTPPDYLLIDGNCTPFFSMPARAVVKGDCKSISIAAASVLAKVTRDRLMRKHDATYPQYGFAKHKGYGTDQHFTALVEHGPCPLHRKSFAPIRALLDAEQPFIYN